MDDDNIISIQAEIDLAPILDAIAKSGDLNNDNAVFEGLAQVEHIKKLLATANERLDEVEKAVKSTINGRAKALYGDEWTVIKGDNYKIVRVKTGAVYEADDDASEEFLKIKVDVNSRKVEEYIKAHSTLPEGITYNPNRNDSIRIALTEVDDA